MKNKKLKPFCFYEETWQHNFWFCIGWSEDNFSKYMLDNFCYEKSFNGSNGACLLCEKKDVAISVIWTRNKDISVLTHECLHAVIDLMSKVGIKLVDESAEAYCYLLSRLMTEAIKASNIKNLAKKPKVNNER